MINTDHYHNCPYCKETWLCNDTCYSDRTTALICQDCYAKWAVEKNEIVRKHGRAWLDDPQF